MKKRLKCFTCHSTIAYYSGDLFNVEFVECADCHQYKAIDEIIESVHKLASSKPYREKSE
jgi:hypothetical protein